FFELGGDSILSIQIVTRAAQAGLRLTTKQLFQHQTVAELAAAAGRGEAAAAAEQGLVTGELPLTPIQHWFFGQEMADPHHYNQSVILSVRRPLDGPRLEQAVGHLTAHHDALRLRFRADAEGWRQRLAGTVEAVEVRRVDVSALGEAERRAAVGRAADEVQRSLDLEHGPLIRVALFDGGAEGPSSLLFVVHHLAVDSVSWRILLEDLQTVYEQLEAGEAVRLRAKTTSFKRWAEALAEYARGPELEAEAAYWSRVAGTRPAALPVDKSGGENTQASAASVSVSLGREQTQRLLKEVPAAYGTQINDVLLLALVRAFDGWAGEPSLLVDMEGHGREEVAEGVDVSRTVGWFTSIYPVLLKLEGGGVGDELRRVKERLRAVPQRGIGYGLLRYMGREETRRLMRELPDAELSFNYLGQLDQVLAEDGLLGAGGGDPSGEPFSRRGRRSHLLSVNSLVAGGRLQVSWTYSENLHERATVERLAADYIAELERIIDHCLTAGEAGGYTPSDFPLAGLGQEALDAVAAAHGRIEDIYPLAPMQQGMLFHSLYAPASGTYFEQMNCRLAGGLDVAAFTRAWQRVIERHAVLRTAFVWEGLDEPLQVVLKEVASPFKELDWSELPPSEQQASLETLLAAERAAGFELSKAPLMHLILIKLGAGAYEFIWSHHHALLDGWCVSILLREVFELYRAFSAGEELRLEPAASYRNYIAWLKRQDLGQAERFWRETLKGFESPTRLTGAHAEEGAESFERAVEEVQLSAELSAQLQALARQNQLTLNTLMQGAWALLLSRYSGERDVLFGVTVSGRPAELPGVETMMGLFINALPMRVRLTGREQLIPWLKALQAWQVELREYEYTPLVQVQGWSEAPKGRPLFDSLFIFENYPVADSALRQGEGGGLQPQAVGLHEQTNYPLTVVSASGPQMPLKISYDCRRFGREAVRRMLGHMQTLLEGFVSRPGLAVSQLPMLTPGESRRLLAEWSGAGDAYAGGQCVYELFERRAELAPQDVALEFGEERLTYGELNRRANGLARQLVSLGVGVEVLAGICMKRSADVVVSMLAVLKAGGAYVYLDPAQPRARLSFMLEDSAPSVVLADTQAADMLGDFKGRVLCPETEWEELAAQGEENLAGRATAENLAYVNYTSGSTGRPKGVLVAHRGLCNLVEALVRDSDIRPASRVLQYVPYSFDVSASDVFTTLSAGATLCVAQEPSTLLGGELTRLLRRERISTVSLPATVLVTMPLEELPDLKTLIVGGESTPPAVVSRWAVGRRFMNAYGPTEATVCATLGECDAESGRLSIGRPLENVTVYVLDGLGEAVPIGVAGELYIGGVGVARGYLNRPALTAERFVPDPYSGEAGGRLYRTGDVARWLPGGELEFVGRLDYQVKIRGYRIEPGEVEAVLGEHAAVQECAVLVREDVPGEKRLVGYVAPRGEVSHGELREYLRQRLPEQLVPSALVLLEALPLNTNGKVNRPALPAPERDTTWGSHVVPPRDGLELHLVQMWEEILNTGPVGVHDNFFELGGHSLLALRLVTQIKKHYGKELPLAVLFQKPTIEELAAVLSEQASLPRQSPLVAVQPRGSERPFFCVHPVGGNVLCYVELARHLGPGRPFYGLQYVLGQEADAAGVEASAARYVEAMREAQPHGPYLLGGWSFGGLVAFEMARQLREQGERVALLALIDSGVPAAAGAVGAAADDAELLARFVTDLGGRFVQGRPAAPVGVSLDALRELTPDEQLRAVAEGAFAADLLPAYGGLEQLKRLFEVFKANSGAAAAYAPKPYGGAVTLLRAGEGPPATDPQLGWGEFVNGAVELHEVPGNHYSILTEPNVRVLAERLGSCLAAACGAGEPDGGPTAEHA
ncbi:MAG: amino acid adenylation domain-containing protein, partial [Pyrinomonadaceae bacterium]